MNANKAAYTLVKLLFSDKKHYSQRFLDTLISSETNWKKLEEKARENRVLVRSFIGLLGNLKASGRNGSHLGLYVKSVLKLEEERRKRNLRLISSVESMFEENNIESVIIKTMDNYPDMGRDADFLIAENFKRAKEIVERDFRGQPLKVTVCDAWVGKASYGIANYDISVELYPKISQLGEEYFPAKNIVRNRRRKSFGGVSLYVTSPEDQLLITCIHRLYRHWMLGIRLCDVYNSIKLIENEKVDGEYLFNVAEDAGIAKGLHFFLHFIRELGVKLRKEVDMDFPFLLSRSAITSLFVNKFFSGVSKGRLSELRMLMVPSLLVSTFATYSLFNKNFIW